jgi:VWFA-related protein
MRVMCVFLLTVLLAAPTWAQEAAAGLPKFAVDVQLVNVGFSVRDRNTGELVRGLGKEDLRVFEDGVQQEIKYFANERQTPLTIGILLDFSPSQEGFEDENVYVAMSFFRRILREQDEAFIVAFGNRIHEICEFTNSMNKLERALRNWEDLYDESPRIGPSERRRGGSAVIDAIYWSTMKRLADRGGRKALIMVGDGKENSSHKHLYDAIEMLQGYDSIFYGLDNGGSQSRANQRLRNRMPMIAEETGGRDFRLEETSLQEAFDQIEAELRALYTLGYHSTNPEKDGKFRKVEIRSPDRTLLVRARPGYYAK